MFSRPTGQRVVRTNQGGTLEAVADEDTPIRPMLFLMGRVRQVPWLWGTIGFTADKNGLTNLTVGPVMRVGILNRGPHITLGAGYGLARVSVGLKDPALAGQPIPAGMRERISRLRSGSSCSACVLSVRT